MRMPQDLSFAVRQFRRSPGFTLSIVLTLALGIGACTTIFSVVDGILFRPLPFPRADRLVSIATLQSPTTTAATNSLAVYRVDTSYPNFFEWQLRNKTFDSLASYEPTPRLFSKLSGEDARVMPAARVSANLFTTLGATPMLGRTFISEEEQPGHRVVILSYELWKSDFAASPNVIGETVKISDEPSTIVGVMPTDFNYPIDESVKFWTTFAADAEGPSWATTARDQAGLSIVGRLRNGTSIMQGMADLTAIQRGIAQQYSEDKNHLGVDARPLLEEFIEGWHSPLTLLLAAVGALILIACANVSGLLLARANTRRAELALRAALGANRQRIICQLLMESLLLAMAGGAAGILLSFLLLRTTLSLIATNLPRAYNITIDTRILAFAILLSAITSVIFGLLPAWKMSRMAPANALREGGPNTTSSHRTTRLRSILVVSETALGFVLLIGSGLLIRSVMNVLRLDPGFDTKHTVAFDIALTNTRYTDPSKLIFFDKLLPQLAALPGVEKVSIGHPMPFTYYGNQWARFSVPGHSDSPDKLPVAIGAVIEPGYFETLSIPLIRGRLITELDNSPKSAPVAVINQSLARRYFPGENPIGRYLVPQLLHAGAPFVGHQIVGIVGDTRTNDNLIPYRPEFYMPYAQDPAHQRPLVVMKVAGDPASYQNAVRRVVANVDKDTPVFRYRTFAEDLSNQAAKTRFEALLISGFGLLALVLAAVGLFALLSYLVSEKTRELGVRIALGASRANILQLVMWRGLILTSLGIMVGAIASLYTTRLVAHSLFHVALLDRRVFLITTVVLAAVSMAATLIPALRATQVDPMRALRDQ